MADTWTDERVVSLREMVASGHSGGQIASALGLTRNQVIGKIMRLNLQLGSHQMVRPAAKPKPKPVADTPVKAGPSRGTTHASKTGAPRPAAPEVAEQRAQAYLETPARRSAFDPDHAPAAARKIPLTDLQVGQCKWPLYEDGPQLFCGADVSSFGANGQPISYCDVHQAVSLSKEARR